MNPFTDRIHRIPRIWSNQTLDQIAHLFEGDIVNVSAWKDKDKQGREYRDYFENASSYTITNFDADKRGFQGQEGEIYLDLEATLPEELESRFDTVFNHTTLEHVFNIQQAFSNLCSMSRDTVVIILPFLQQYHSNYGDYWRLTPLAIQKLFERQGFELIYQDFNRHRASSVYTLSVASCKPEKWEGTFADWKFDYRDPHRSGHEAFIGCQAISNRAFRFRSYIQRKLRFTSGGRRSKAA
ncbi:MAG: hypothetical protein P8N76_28755 [Pirellulaceae bacterium]|nr:hypothetical protein [Pirellulaceae bacterium]